MEEILSDLRAAERLPIIVGGTGAYFRALTTGLARIPEADPAIRRESEGRITREGLACVARELERRDPRTAARIDLQNPRRVARALEVLMQTGSGLAEWHARTPPALMPPSKAARIVLAPPGELLKERISRRFDAMMAAGALGEARKVLETGADRSLPGMRPIGASALFACLENRLDQDAAVELAKSESRKYARRQVTWFRNQMREWAWIEEPNPERAVERIRQGSSFEGRTPE